MYPNFDLAIEVVKHQLKTVSYPLANERWQSSDVKHQPGHEMREVFNTSFTVSLGSEHPDHYHEDIKPNLPWADDHFEERVGGMPLNPGEEWKNWPWANSANRHRTEGEQFSHTYMERYWPKLARRQDVADADINPFHSSRGIRYPLGDLMDVVQHLEDYPESRQAFLPVWFPEDTGVVHRQRVPCTLGYHFLYRHGYLHITYYIRSCDFTRHFRDDLYLSLRLLVWMLDHLRGANEAWADPKPGMFVFHCASMHMFENDYQALQS